MPKSLVSLIATANALVRPLEHWLTPFFDLALRLYVAEIFFRAGWLKLSDWSGTLSLFDYVYRVPLLAPHLAAALATAGELGLPVLLVVGLTGRFAAGGLFVVNLMAAISFPDISDLGMRDHWLWGTMLLVTVFHGPGRWSLDFLLARRWMEKP